MRSQTPAQSCQQGQAGQEGCPRKERKGDRTNKKAVVIALMKCAIGATLDDIMKATDWQPHTMRGFVCILSSNEEEKIESSKNALGERNKIAK